MLFLTWDTYNYSKNTFLNYYFYVILLVAILCYNFHFLLIKKKINGFNVQNAKSPWIIALIICLNYLVFIMICSQLSMQIITNINLKRLMNSKGKIIIYWFQNTTSLVFYKKKKENRKYNLFLQKIRNHLAQGLLLDFILLYSNYFNFIWLIRKYVKKYWWLNTLKIVFLFLVRRFEIFL